MRLFTTILPLLVTLTQAAAAQAQSSAGDEAPAPTYAPCGGDAGGGPAECEEAFACVDNPRKEECGQECDDPGICVPEGLEMCGGFAGFKCPEEGQFCIDDPFDDCDPKNGGADCAGICV